MIHVLVNTFKESQLKVKYLYGPIPVTQQIFSGDYKVWWGVQKRQV